MSTPETLHHDAAVEAAGELLERCPECGCASLVITQSLPATRIDPACSAGYCVCRESPMLSVCCGAPEHPDVEGFCSQCRDGTGFERECPCEYEFG